MERNVSNTTVDEDAIGLIWIEDDAKPHCCDKINFPSTSHSHKQGVLTTSPQTNSEIGLIPTQEFRTTYSQRPKVTEIVPERKLHIGKETEFTEEDGIDMCRFSFLTPQIYSETDMKHDSMNNLASRNAQLPTPTNDKDTDGHIRTNNTYHLDHRLTTKPCNLSKQDDSKRKDGHECSNRFLRKENKSPSRKNPCACTGTTDKTSDSGPKTTFGAYNKVSSKPIAIPERGPELQIPRVPIHISDQMTAFEKIRKIREFDGELNEQLSVTESVEMADEDNVDICDHCLLRLGPNGKRLIE